MDIRVRAYEPDDLPAMVAAHAACYPNEHWAADDFRDFCNRPCQRHAQVILAGQEVAGTLLYQLETGVVLVRRLAVAPAFRRRGVGRAAFVALAASRAGQRRGRFEVRLRDDNRDGQLFLRALGFRCHAVTRGVYADGADAYEFALTVAVPAKPAAV